MKRKTRGGLSARICHRFMGTPPEKWIRRKLREPLCRLHPLAQTEKVLEAYYAKCLSLLFAVLFGGVFLAAASAILQSQESGVQQVSSLSRSGYGGETTSRTLQVQIGTDGTPEPYTVSVSAQAYTQEELDALFVTCAKKLETLILGDNPSLGEVTDDLVLVDEIPDTGVTVWWQTDRTDLVSADGTLHTDALTEAGEIVTLTAHLSAQEQEYIQTLAVCVKRAEKTEAQANREALEEKIAAADEDEQTEETLSLPASVNGEPVQYTQGEAQTAAWPLILLLTPIAALLIQLGRRSDMKKALEARGRQLQLDYPEIVSKLNLLFSAGLTVREAWSRIVQSYLYACGRGTPTRYAYEEMVAAYREMQGGMTETEAYDRFARRCGQSAYLKLSALLAQNLRKGTRGLTQMLSYEAAQAMEERKSLSKRMGEEAGTKLLVPMVLMLAVVLLILVVPAFLSMQTG